MRSGARSATDRIHVFGHSWGGLLGQLYAKAHPKRVASLVLCCSMANMRRNVAGMESNIPEDYLAHMSLDAPVPILQGEQDVIRETNALLAERFPRATNVRIPDAAHCPWMEAPAAFSKAVLDFYRSVASAAPGWA